MKSIFLQMFLISSPIVIHAVPKPIPVVSSVKNGDGYRTYSLDVPTGVYRIQFSCGADVDVPSVVVKGPGTTEVEIFSMDKIQPECFVLSWDKL